MSLNPALADPYPLFSLPRVPDLGLAAKLVVPSIRSTDDSYIDVGISKSLICSYILKPTPKLVWLHPLSPSTVVDSMDVIENSNTKTYAIGLSDRRKHKLLIITRLLAGEDEPLLLEVGVLHKVAAVKFAEDGKHIYVVLSTGLLHLYKLQDNALEQKELSSLSGSLLASPEKDALLFHAFITDEDAKKSKKRLFLLTVERNAAISTTAYKVVSLELENTFEVKRDDEQTQENLLFEYQGGLLYRFNTDKKEISTIPVFSTGLVPAKLVSVKALFDNDEATDLYSFKVPSLDRLVVARNNRIYLFNFKFEALLDTYETSDHVYLNQTVCVRGTTPTNSSTFVVYTAWNQKLNETNLSLLNVNVGQNKLNECLGKSLAKGPHSAFIKGIPDVLEEDFGAQEKTDAGLLSDVYAQLKVFSEEANTTEWNRLLVSTLRKKGELKRDKPFNVDTDRSVDVSFINAVLALIFSVQHERVAFINDKFIPDRSLIYLLTHPLYPYQYTRGLLTLLNTYGKARLLRQAIISCLTISMKELLSQLISLSDVEEVSDYSLEILSDIVFRLVHEYSVPEITSHLRKMVTDETEASAAKLESILKVLLQIDNNHSWALVQSVIDIGGLFTWSVETIDMLNARIDSKVDALMANNYNLTLTNQALLNNPLSTIIKRHDIVDAREEQQMQLSLILKLNSSSRNKGKKAESGGIQISKKIPSYSIEKLVL